MLVKKSSAALPCKSGHLPGLLLRQQLYERVASSLVLRSEQQLQVARTLDEFLLLGRTALKNAHQVLDALLSRFDNLHQANFVRDVADDGQTLLLGFGHSG